MVGGIYADLVVLIRTEEGEEGDPGEVDDGDVTWGGSLGGIVQVLDKVNR